MKFYVGVLDGAGDVWGVCIPDFPGCVGGGPTPEAAMQDATIALREATEHKRGVGVGAPEPSRFEDIVASGEVQAGETCVMVPLALDSGRTVRANLTLDAGLLEAIDAEARLSGLTRSAFVASAAREKIEARR